MIIKLEIPHSILSHAWYALSMRCIRLYCEASYAYYQHDVSLMKDHEFDELCKFMYDNFAEIEPFDRNGYLDRAALKAGTGYDLKLTGQTLDFAKAAVHEHFIKKSCEELSPLVDDPDVQRIASMFFKGSMFYEGADKPEKAKAKKADRDLDALFDEPKKKPKKLDLDDLL